MFFADVNQNYAEKMYTIAYTNYTTQPSSKYEVKQDI